MEPTRRNGADARGADAARGGVGQPRDGSGAQHRGPDRVIALTFWAVSVICLVDLNDLLRMWVGVERAFSVPLLACCLVLLTGLLRMRFMDAVGWPGVLILACLLSYSGLGMLVSLASATEFESDAAGYLVRHLSSVVLILATAAGARRVLHAAGEESLLRGLMLVATGSCLLMIASPRLVDLFVDPPEDGTYRYFGAFSDPNMAAMVACFGVVSALAFLRAGRQRVLAHGAALVSGTALAGTFSRTALVVLACLLAGAVVASRGVQRRRLAGGLAVLAVVGALGVRTLDLSALEARQLQRWESLLEIVELSSVDDVSLAGRMTLWRLALEETLEAPLLGNGLGRLHHLDGAWYNDDGVLMGAHNQYLVLAGEAGFVPLTLFVLYLALTLTVDSRSKGSVAILGAVSGWALVVVLFSVAFHGVLLQKACSFVIGVSCAAVARGPGRGTSPRTEAPAPAAAA